jgi:hypothetical protein
MNSACHCADVSFATAGSTSFGRMCAQPVSHCVCRAWLRKGWADSTNRAGPKPMRLEIQSLARCCLALLGMRTPVDRARCSESTAVLGLGECWGRARSAIERVQTDRDTTLVPRYLVWSTRSRCALRHHSRPQRGNRRHATNKKYVFILLRFFLDRISLSDQREIFARR